MIASTPAAKGLALDPALRDYLASATTGPDPVTAGLAARTREVTGPTSAMMIDSAQGLLLTVLARALDAHRALDVGTFTGASALALARGLAPGGRVLTLDVSDEHRALAEHHWHAAGIADRIDARRGPALRAMRALPEAPHLDIAFVDADKLNYPRYCAEIIPRLRSGGLLLVDNVLLDGHVVTGAPDGHGEPGDDGGLLAASVAALRGLNAALAADERLRTVMLPVVDGLTVAQRV